MKLSNRTKGTLCIIGSAFSFALMGVCIRLAGDVPSMQKAFFRNLVAVFFAFFIIKRSHLPFHPEKKRDWKFLLARAGFGTIGLLCNFYAVDHLNLSDAAMLNKMSPFFAIVFSIFILSERLSLFQGVSVVVAFLGSLLIIKPDPSNMALVPSLIGLLGGLGAGIAYTFVRLMSKHNIPGSLIVFVFSGFSCLVCLPYVLVVHAPMTAAQFLSLLGAGVCGCLGQFCITNAYRFAPAREISVYDYTQIIFSALLGWLIFAELPDIYSLLGYLVICGTGVVMFFHQRRT